MKELYEGHSENLKKASKKGVIISSENANKKRDEYYINPNRCLECKNVLDFYKRNNKFCGSSCSATHNNKKRDSISDETKERISKKLTGRKLSEEHKKKCSIHLVSGGGRNLEKLRFDYDNLPKKCNVCGNVIKYENRHRVTCSDDCKLIAKTNRTYLNGSRKTIYYKDVVLESSWELELAIFLDENNIKWVRPKPIKWNDGVKDRLYYPDFYLTEKDIYLDPKNPYCMEKDKLKMSEIGKKVRILYGDIKTIKEKIIRE
jgi:hypothetical protein